MGIHLEYIDNEVRTRRPARPYISPRSRKVQTPEIENHHSGRPTGRPGIHPADLPVLGKSVLDRVFCTGDGALNPPTSPSYTPGAYELFDTFSPRLILAPRRITPGSAERMLPVPLGGSGKYEEAGVESTLASVEDVEDERENTDMAERAGVMGMGGGRRPVGRGGVRGRPERRCCAWA